MNTQKNEIRKIKSRLVHTLETVSDYQKNKRSIDETVIEVLKATRCINGFVYNIERLNSIKKSVFEEASKSLIECIGAYEVQISHREASFIPSDIKPFLKPAGTERKYNFIPIDFRFEALRGRLGFIVEVRPFKDPCTRRRLLKCFSAAGFDIKEISFNPESKYTRIFTKHTKLHRSDTKYTLIKKMDRMLNDSAMDSMVKIWQVLKGFDWLQV